MKSQTIAGIRVEVGSTETVRLERTAVVRSPDNNRPVSTKGFRPKVLGVPARQASTVSPLWKTLALRYRKRDDYVAPIPSTWAGTRGTFGLTRGEAKAGCGFLGTPRASCSLAMLRTSLVVKSGIASFDQAILSTASFAISIILIKTVSTAEFGHYSVALPVSLFLISIQNAVINAPLIVLLAAKRGDEKRRYAGSLCYGQLLALVPAVTLGLVVIAMLTVWKLDASVASIAAALCLASIGILLREFLRAYFFADESPLQVLKVDGLYIGLVLSFIAFTHLIFEISVASVFLVMGVSSLLAGLAFSVGQHWRYESESIRQSFHENWHFGKWALLGVIVTHIQNYSYLYFLGVLLGSVAVADVSASRLVLTPLLLAHAGWNTIAVPHGSRLREERRLNRFFHLQVLASLAFTLGTAAYLIVLMIFSGLLETLLFSGKYESSFDYLPFWGIIFCVRFLSVSASCGLQALKDFKIISKVNCLTMLLTVVGTYFLIRHYAVKGGLVALILGESLLAVTLWFYFAKTLFAKHREQHAETRTPVALFGPSDTDSVTLVKE